MPVNPDQYSNLEKLKKEAIKDANSCSIGSTLFTLVELVKKGQEYTQDQAKADDVIKVNKMFLDTNEELNKAFTEKCSCTSK